MESLRAVVASMEEGEFLSSVDIRDAYLHIPIHPSHHRFLRFAIQESHYQFVALPFGLATAPRVFTKVLAPLMALLHSRGIVTIPYLDDILIKASSYEENLRSLQITLDTLQRFGWILNFPKSCLTPTQQISFLGLLFNTQRARIFLPQEKLITLTQSVQCLRMASRISIRYCMRTLGLMVASFEAVQFAQFHSRPLQQNILKYWNRSKQTLDQPIPIPSALNQALEWWLSSPNLTAGRSFLPVNWTVVATDASLSGWGGLLGTLTVQGRWSRQEALLPINLLELRAIYLTVTHWTPRLSGKPVRIQTDNATAVAYINRQGGTRSQPAMREAGKILSWAEAHVPALSAIHIPGVDNWIADFLSRETIHPGEWALHPDTFKALCQRWGVPDVDLMASRLNHQLPLYVSRARDPRAVATDALTIPWSSFHLPYIFPPFPLIPRVLRKIRSEGVQVILIAPNWPRRVWYADLIGLLADVPWLLPLDKQPLSQGPIFHPNSAHLHLTAWLLRPRF